MTSEAFPWYDFDATNCHAFHVMVQKHIWSGTYTCKRDIHDTGYILSYTTNRIYINMLFSLGHGFSK